MTKPKHDISSLFSSPRLHRMFMIGTGVALAIPVLALASPVAIPNQFNDGEVVSAQPFNENFEEVEGAVNDNDARITALENQVPQVTIRKSTGSYERAIAFCAGDEVLTGGGCFMPPENRYDPAYADYATYYTGNYPRALVGMTSVPVAAGTTLGSLRPTANAGGNIIPFSGDIVAANSGSVAAGLGGGWGCRAGIVQHNAAPSAQALTTNIYESWYFHVKAYAVCMKVS